MWNRWIISAPFSGCRIQRPVSIKIMFYVQVQEIKKKSSSINLEKYGITVRHLSKWTRSNVQTKFGFGFTKSSIFTKTFHICSKCSILEQYLVLDEKIWNFYKILFFNIFIWTIQNSFIEFLLLSEFLQNLTILGRTWASRLSPKT